jgi:hypothetical protein
VISETAVIPLSGEKLAQADNPRADASNSNRRNRRFAGKLPIMSSYWSDFGWGAALSLRSRHGAGVDGRILV